jgi:hypothetical protein
MTPTNQFALDLARALSGLRPEQFLEWLSTFGEVVTDSIKQKVDNLRQLAVAARDAGQDRIIIDPADQQNEDTLTLEIMIRQLLTIGFAAAFFREMQERGKEGSGIINKDAQQRLINRLKQEKQA